MIIFNTYLGRTKISQKKNNYIYLKFKAITIVCKRFLAKLNPKHYPQKDRLCAKKEQALT